MMRYLFATLWFLGAGTVGVLFDHCWLKLRYQRVRACTFCHSDSTENNEAFTDICTDCERYFRSIKEANGVDDEQLDGTDWAHPAWWRGEKDGVRGTVDALGRVIENAAAGKARSGVFGNDALERLADRIHNYVRQAQGTSS